MVSVIRLDSDEVQKFCDSANQDVDEDNKVQIASYLCPVTSPVQGETTVTTLLAKGPKKSYELGPGKNQSHLAVIYTLGASYLAELLLALSREWTRKQKQRILAPEMAAGGVPQVVPDQR
uniref:Uncharacterized protein n=1 Tax=Salix viminalis TaxID=40686 RepID=A0A6N2LV18_SALVM